MSVGGRLKTSRSWVTSSRLIRLLGDVYQIMAHYPIFENPEEFERYLSEDGKALRKEVLESCPSRWARDSVREKFLLEPNSCASQIHCSTIEYFPLMVHQFISALSPQST
ncbi:hypothetical protein PMAYCL1PPCAC_15340 [Pristionchus mayeri]|uniref:Uncharacterized protein n=1 Tax=Pristionchus mayeri TaxID=1317129 RepID=A0AAN5CIU3_9BILA|nr:hypothetical protein PMAYCL1PPCAC_15340 [Pristionchus mayeri]